MPISTLAHMLVQLAVAFWPSRDLNASRNWLIVKRERIRQSTHWKARLLEYLADDFIKLSYVELMQRGALRKRGRA